MRKGIFFLLVYSLVTINSFAQSGEFGDNLTWDFNSETGALTISTISGTGSMGNLIISAPWDSFLSQITQVVVNFGVTDIGNGAFSGCRNLASVSIPYSVTTIKHSAFTSCTALTSVFIPPSVTRIETAAFRASGLTSLNLFTTVTYIGNTAFHDTPWFRDQEDGMVRINNILYTFKGQMPENTSIWIPNGIEIISPYAFYYTYTNLAYVNISNSVTTLGAHAFAACTGMTSLTIGSGVVNYGEGVFADCRALRTIVSLNPVPANIDNSVFRYVNKNTCALMVPDSVVSLYAIEPVWRDFKIIIEIDLDTTNFIKEPEKISIAVYPNPTTGQLKITNYELRVENIEVFDIYGRKQKVDGKKPNGETEMIIDISHLPTGMYVVKIITERGIVVEKIIKK